MAQTKSAGSTSLGRDSRPKYLGVKLSDGQKVRKGQIIIRQRGTKYVPGKNVKLGKDYTIYATKDGVVKFYEKNKTLFTGNKRKVKVVSVI
ncbi:50S ribosomal protein L27 [bacterium HR34]|nr:50S ribosomal protein L27 [bacterium HR34]